MFGSSINDVTEWEMRVLLVTANLGSIFEDEGLMRAWVRVFAERVSREEPQFLALHCQEVGGKETKRVTNDLFFGALLQSLPQFVSARVFLDDDSHSFTALGSVYLSRDSDSFIWLFDDKVFQRVSERRLLDANDQSVQKSKFPSSVAVDAQTARKGFLRTRWRLRGLIVDLVNVHLFHDACNLRAARSEFARIRRAALQWTLERVADNSVPLFVFGDFNFRLDARAFIRTFTEKSLESRDDQLSFGDNKEDVVLVVRRKRFEFKDKTLFSKNWKNLLLLDKELKSFETLHEFPIAFPPSYPFAEDLTSGYMATRCPSWCDRILLNGSARSLVSEVDYSLIGGSQPMGDHKPVALNARLSGTRYVRTAFGVFRETSV